MYSRMWMMNFAYGWLLTNWLELCVQCALVHVHVHVRVQCVCDLTTNTCTLLFQFFSLSFSSFFPILDEQSSNDTHSHAHTTTKTIIVDNIHSTRNRSKCQKRAFTWLHMVHVLKLARLRLIVSCVVFFSLDMFFFLFSFYLLQQFFSVCKMCFVRLVFFCGCLLYSLFCFFLFKFCG